MQLRTRVLMENGIWRTFTVDCFRVGDSLTLQDTGGEKVYIDALPEPKVGFWGKVARFFGRPRLTVETDKE